MEPPSSLPLRRAVLKAVAKELEEGEKDDDELNAADLLAKAAKAFGRKRLVKTAKGFHGDKQRNEFQVMLERRLTSEEAFKLSTAFFAALDDQSTLGEAKLRLFPPWCTAAESIDSDAAGLCECSCNSNSNNKQQQQPQQRLLLLLLLLLLQRLLLVL